MLALKTVVVAVFATLFLAAPAQSPEYQDQQITLIAPFNAGGGDRLAGTIDEFRTANGNQSFNFRCFRAPVGLWGLARWRSAPTMAKRRGS